MLEISGREFKITVSKLKTQQGKADIRQHQIGDFSREMERIRIK